MNRNKYIISENTRQRLANYAQMLIDENRLMDASSILKNCTKLAVKDKNNNCITDGGAFDFMVYLMKHCSEDQIKQVEYLLNEFFPNMRRDWLFLGTFLTYQIYMYRRFANDGIYSLISRIEKYMGNLFRKFTTYFPKLQD